MQSPLQVKPDIFYDVLVAVNGTLVTVSVDGQFAFSYSFPKQFVLGVESGLNKGMIGVGSRNARGTFDDVAVQVLPPAITLDRSENFDAAPPPLFPAPEAGTWTSAGGRYATPGTGGIALSRIDIGGSLHHSAYVELSATVRTAGVAGIFFDAQPTGAFKFAALDVPGQRVIVGHYTTRGGLVIDASAPRALVANTDYSIFLVLKGAGLSVSVAGALALSYGFNSALADGGIGVLGVSGATSFDSFRIRTNDPAFESTQPPGPPAVSVNPTGVTEGGTGTTRTVTITLTLSAPALGGETVRWITADGTASAGSDYVAASGTVTFAVGATSATIAVTVNGDAAWEQDETFSILLSNPVGLTLGASSALVQIVNDDAAPSVTVTAPTSQASEVGPAGGSFVVARSDASGALAIALTWGGTAIAGTDYVVSVSGGTLSADRATLMLAAGVASATITIVPIVDGLVEGSETVVLGIAAGAGYTPGSPASATVSIADAAAPPPAQPELSVVSVSVAEGDKGRATVTITVRLSAPATSTVTVRATTRNGTATAGSDYVATTVTLTFAPGATTATFTVSVIADKTREGDETFFVDLSSATGATIAQGATGTVTIRNDDQLLLATAIGAGTSIRPLAGRAAARVLRAAIRRWVAAGTRQAVFAGVRVRIARLGGARLAKVSGRTIVIDADAAGWGWHIGLRGRVASGRIDLLTVILHELGHVAGLDHTEHGLMRAALAPGERRLGMRRARG